MESDDVKDAVVFWARMLTVLDVQPGGAVVIGPAGWAGLQNAIANFEQKRDGVQS